MNDVERAHQRERRIALSAVMSALSKGANLFVMIISVPLAVGHLGSERYGLWMTLTSLIALLGFSDLGVGASLVNAVARTHAEGRDKALAGVVATGFSLLVAIAAVILLAFFACYPWMNWARLLNITQPALTLEAAPAFAVLVVGLALSLPLNVVTQVQNGLLEGYRASVWSALGAMAGLGGLMLAVRANATLPALVFAVAAGPVLAAALNSAYEFTVRRPELRPSFSATTGPQRKALLGSSLLFFVLQVCVTVVNNSDNFVAAHILSLEDVAHYSVSQRLFSIPPMLLGFVFTPLWPAYQQAKTRGDHAWIRRTFRRSLWLAAAIAVPYAVVAVLAGPTLVTLWVGPDFVLTFGQLLGFGAWCVCGCLAGALGMCLNGLNVLLPQAIFAVVNIGVSILLKVNLTRQLDLAGLAWGGALSTLALTVLPCSWLCWRTLRDLETRHPPRLH